MGVFKSGEFQRLTYSILRGDFEKRKAVKEIQKIYDRTARDG